ncbi:hypothetical protein [Nitrincola sp.]|uniref:hypothetical protein n=1 Tax=Nitrincola sp. TaxID=1926584 RepID=UPI003A914A04
MELFNGALSLPVMAALFSAVPVQAETVEEKCVQIGDMHHRLEETLFGGSELVWEAAVENHCDLPVDLVLNLHLQDAQDKRLYSARQVLIVVTLLYFEISISVG